MEGFLLIALTFGLMWALLIRPQQRKAREQRALIEAVQVGEAVMTTSGIYGTVVQIDAADDVVWIEVAEGVELKLARGAIGRRLGAAAPLAGGLDDDFDDDRVLLAEENDAGIVDDVHPVDDPTAVGGVPADPDVVPGTDDTGGPDDADGRGR